jgi:hypothetical protein
MLTAKSSQLNAVQIAIGNNAGLNKLVALLRSHSLSKHMRLIIIIIQVVLLEAEGLSLFWPFFLFSALCFHIPDLERLAA